MIINKCNECTPGTSLVATASDIYVGRDIVAPTTSKTGYNFKGWYTAVDGGKK